MFKQLVVVFALLFASFTVSAEPVETQTKAKIVKVDKLACDASEIIFKAMVNVAWNGATGKQLTYGITEHYVTTESAYFPDSYWMAVNYALNATEEVSKTMNSNDQLKVIRSVINSDDEEQIKEYVVNRYVDNCKSSIGMSFKIYRLSVQ